MFNFVLKNLGPIALNLHLTERATNASKDARFYRISSHKPDYASTKQQELLAMIGDPDSNISS